MKTTMMTTMRSNSTMKAPKVFLGLAYCIGFWTTQLASSPPVAVVAAFTTGVVLPSCRHPSSWIRNPSTPFPTTTSRFARKDWFVPDSQNEDDVDDDEEEDDDDYPLTSRERLPRDQQQQQDPVVKRKPKNGGGGGGKKEGYKPLDNRDQLPFVVKKVTPDPYTHREVKKARQKRAPLPPPPPRPLSITTSSRLYQRNNNQDGSDASTLLGEFQLDKSTTSGDVIVLGEREYQVQTARCQYKYAGGKRFVMVRKILEVKEVTRVHKEEALLRQFKSSPSATHHPPPLE